MFGTWQRPDEPDDTCHLPLHNGAIVLAAVRRKPFVTPLLLIEMQIDLHAAVSIFNIGMPARIRRGMQAFRETGLAVSPAVLGVTNAPQEVSGMVWKRPGKEMSHTPKVYTIDATCERW